jgi:hypothetical protein
MNWDNIEAVVVVQAISALLVAVGLAWQLWRRAKRAAAAEQRNAIQAAEKTMRRLLADELDDAVRDHSGLPERQRAILDAIIRSAGAPHLPPPPSRPAADQPRRRAAHRPQGPDSAEDEARTGPRPRRSWPPRSGPGSEDEAADIAEHITKAASDAAAAVAKAMTEQGPRLSVWLSLAWVLVLGGAIGGLGALMLTRGSDDLIRGAGGALMGAAAAFVLRDMHEIVRRR